MNAVWDTIASSIIAGAHLAPNSQWEEEKAELLAEMGNHTSWTVVMACFNVGPVEKESTCFYCFCFFFKGHLGGHISF